MPKRKSDPADVDKLLPLARFFQYMGKIETYKQAVSRLHKDNPIRKEIEIVIRQWEEH
jgi:hypothetical protein